MLLPWQHHWIVKSCTISKRNSKKCFCIWRTCKWWFYLLTSIRSNMPKQIHSLVFFLLAAHNIKEKHNTGWNAALSVSLSLSASTLWFNGGNEAGRVMKNERMKNNHSSVSVLWLNVPTLFSLQRHSVFCITCNHAHQWCNRVHLYITAARWEVKLESGKRLFNGCYPFLLL